MRKGDGLLEGDEQHAVTSVGGASYAYDANGNLTSRAGKALTWYADTTLASMVGPDSVSESYTYTADGQRATRQRTILQRTILQPSGTTEERRGLPSYDRVPAIPIGRLALARVDQGVVVPSAGAPERVTAGSLLPHEALAVCQALAGQLGLRVVVVDARDERVPRFYRRHDFIALPDRPARLSLPVAILARLFGDSAP